MPSTGYDFGARLLHRLALNRRFVAEAAFDIERRLYRSDGDAAAGGRHVFVAGLARAGTTVLMRRLHETGAFRSLTYRDMPFVLAPNLWQRLTRRRQRSVAAAERAHGDGLMVDFDSPEALEEVFWRTFCGRDYIRRDRLVPHRIDNEAREAFRSYLALLLRDRPGGRYLSKNNNNLLRLPDLAACCPGAAILVPFREPLQQAASLMRQHRRFMERHAADPFSRQYMAWLVHHEFGSDHRPFDFAEEPRPLAPLSAGEERLDYWLRLWIDSYRHVLKSAPAGSHLLSYERLCSGGESLWARICDALDLPVPPTAEPFRLSRQAIDEPVDPALRKAAESLYSDLRDRETWT